MVLYADSAIACGFVVCCRSHKWLNSSPVYKHRVSFSYVSSVLLELLTAAKFCVQQATYPLWLLRVLPCLVAANPSAGIDDGIDLDIDEVDECEDMSEGESTATIGNNLWNGSKQMNQKEHNTLVKSWGKCPILL